MTRSRATLAALLSLSPRYAWACDCAGGNALFDAETVIVAQVVALELPSLNRELPDSPARSDVVQVRLVAREALRGDFRGALQVPVLSAGMCEVSPPRLGEWLIVAVPDRTQAPDQTLAFTFCSEELSLGTDWQGWDEATLRLRDALRAGDRERLEPLRWEYRRWPRFPPPPLPPVSG